jgi:ABC-type transport system involved in multi-copper enzyme maturation permease subunit
MNWLPVVNRELRVAARKPSTFWLRVAAALTALVIGGGGMLLHALNGAGMSGMGSALFAVLTWLCLAAGLCAGLFFTSDCLSEEKREGTLGLLFLTDLRGYDVVLGKLLATSLRGFYALLAVLPILAITLLMGGVSGAQFWKSALALVNALFFSLAAAMFVSALSRDSQKALTATLFLLLLLALGGPIVDIITSMGKPPRGFQPLWSVVSPGYVLVTANAYWTHYWIALVVTQLLGWAMLAAACALVPHTWQERKKAGANRKLGWAYAWRYGGARRRLRLRQKLIGQQPVAWLVCRERWQSLGLWSVTILVVGGFVAALILDTEREIWMFWNVAGGLFTLILYLWAASQACRFPLEARRSGLFELLLATPLSERQIVGGQWRALVRMFGLPVLLLLAVQLSAGTLSQLAFHRIATQAATMTSSVVTNQNGTISSQTVVIGGKGARSGKTRPKVAPAPRRLPVPTGSDAMQVAAGVAAAVAGALSTAANLLALCWFGMWMGMTSRSANLATLKTMLFVQIIPWFAIMFGAGIGGTALMSGMLFSRSANPLASFAWWPILSAFLMAVVVVAKDVIFVVWSRNKLHASFRDEAARSLGQPRLVALPRLPAVAAPPVIAAPR